MYNIGPVCCIHNGYSLIISNTRTSRSLKLPEGPMLLFVVLILIQSPKRAGEQVKFAEAETIASFCLKHSLLFSTKFWSSPTRMSKSKLTTAKLQVCFILAETISFIYHFYYENLNLLLY